MPHVLLLKLIEKYSGTSSSIFSPLFDGERRADFKFVPFVFFSMWLVCGSINCDMLPTDSDAWGIW